jgi:hypothetical protein
MRALSALHCLLAALSLCPLESCTSKTLVVQGIAIVDSSTGASTVGLGEYRQTKARTGNENTFERPVSANTYVPIACDKQSTDLSAGDG